MASEKNIRILILGGENCGLIANLKNGFKLLGYQNVTTAVRGHDAFFPGNRYDYDLERPHRISSDIKTNIKHAWRLIKWKCRRLVFDNLKFYNYDVYIFSWFTLRDDLSDLVELRKRNKKIVTLFIGSDVRWIEAFRQEFTGNSYKGHIEESWTKKIRTLRMGELYSSSIFSVPDQSSMFIRGYYYMFMPLDIGHITHSPQFRQKPVIIHAPSKRDIKGSSLILQAMETLRAEGHQFDFEFLENIPNKVLVHKLEQADILIDQLYLNGPATLACEAMAAGCAVAAKFIDGGSTADAPLCYIDEHCLLDQLRKLVSDLEYRKKLIARGRQFVEHHNSMQLVATRVLESLERDKRKDYDYRPHFFVEKFVLPAHLQYTPEIVNLNKEVAAIYGSRATASSPVLEGEYK